jgi:hypothetical protein
MSLAGPSVPVVGPKDLLAAPPFRCQGLWKKRVTEGMAAIGSGADSFQTEYER